MRSHNVLIFRTARTLGRCLERLSIDCPTARVWIVHTPGCEAELDALGIEPGQRIPYRRSRFLTLFKFLTSRTFLDVRQRRYSRVVALYSDGAGTDYMQIDAICRILAGSGARAFTPGGDLLEIPSLGKRVPDMAKTLICTSAARIVLACMVDLPLAVKRISSGVTG